MAEKWMTFSPETAGNRLLYFSHVQFPVKLFHKTALHLQNSPCRQAKRSLRPVDGGRRMNFIKLVNLISNDSVS